jgi:serine/threonine protein kinase
MLGIYETPTKMYIAMELCRGGDVLDELHAEKKIKEKEVKTVIMKLLSALSHLHSLGLMHRDIKLENLLYNHREEGKEVMLCDFGMGKQFQKGTVMTGNAEGSIYYVAPEVLMGEYTEACDLWSAGIATYMLLSGRTPFKGATDEETVNKIVDADVQFDEQYWTGVTPEAREFIRSMLKKEASERPTADQALAHPWFKGVGTPRASRSRRYVLNC